MGSMENFTTIEECTPQLRWVAKSIMGFEQKLQQGWKVTLFDVGAVPYKQYIDWRDVPFHAIGAPPRT